MNSFERRYAIAAFIRATRNEAAIDKHWAIKAGIPENTGIPRPIKLGKYLKRNPRMGLALSAALRLVWFTLIFPSYIFYQGLSMVRRLGKGDGINRVLSEDSIDIVVAATSRAPKVIPYAETFDKNALWIMIPWVKVDLPVEFQRIHVESLLCFLDLFTAASMAWEGARRFSRVSNGSNVLQTYTAFSWFCTYLALRRLSINALWSANHYDRWAIMLDVLPCNGREECGEMSGAGKDDRLAEMTVRKACSSQIIRNLVQHGIEESIYLPTKLKRVDILHVDDKESADLFGKYIVKNISIKTVTKKKEGVEKFVPYAIPSGYSISIMIVGHPIYQDVQEKIYHLILSLMPDAWFLYKPHPLFEGSAKPWVKKSRVSVIDDRNIFPCAALVISYNSTLARAYVNAGTPVFFHETILDRDESEVRYQIAEMIAKNREPVQPW